MIAKRKFILRALLNTRPNARFVLGAPTNQQAKDIFWPDLKAAIPGCLVKRISNSELTMKLVTGATIKIAGMDVPARIEGPYLDGILITEFGNCRPTMWHEHVRASLSTRGRLGWAIVEGTPEGRNHYYDLKLRAETDPAWGIYHWNSSDVIDPDEVEAARHSMDEQTFRQEYEGDFVTWDGQAYYSFGEHNIRAGLPYNEFKPLIFCFDFNVSPGVAIVAQEHLIDNDLRTCVIGEVYKRQNSNTPYVCQRLIDDWHNHRGPVIAYGDATGGSKGTAKIAGTDWDQIAKIMEHTFGERFELNVPKANPSERGRVSAMNSRFRTFDNTVWMYIDPEKAPNLVTDCESTTCNPDGSLDKKKDKGRWTHPSDALGYYVAKEHPVYEHEYVEVEDLLL
jgi:hypothetical protein